MERYLSFPYVSNVLKPCLVKRILSEVPKWTQCVNDVSAGETPSELQPVAKEVRIWLQKMLNVN